jgi:hypothetical protein
MRLPQRTALRWPLIAAAITALIAPAPAQAEKLDRVGVYLYENVEGFHTAGAACGTSLAEQLAPNAKGVIAVDKVPLESNETVRILDELTKDRKTVIAAVHTWLAGGAISTPSVTLADDAIKFKDLTWHVDQEAILKEAGKMDLSHVLLGTVTGLVKESGNRAAQSGSKLFSVTVQANFQLLEVASGTGLWAKTYRDVKAGFDPRTAFDAGALHVGEMAGKDLAARLGGTN